jgi:hypothetical protein
MGQRRRRMADQAPDAVSPLPAAALLVEIQFAAA